MAAKHTHGKLMVVAGADPKDKGIFASEWGHYGRTIAVVSNRHEYAHEPEYGAQLAESDAERIAACWNAMEDVSDPIAFRADVKKLVEICKEMEARERGYSADPSRLVVARFREALAKLATP